MSHAFDCRTRAVALKEEIQVTDSLFAELGIIEPLCRALAAVDYQQPTPIQTQAIPQLLAGKDLLGIAQTGTGKTAAFAVPMLQRLSQSGPPAGPDTVRALILAPTRELAIQIGEDFEAYGKHLNLRVATIFGGVGQNPQASALRRGIDVLVATPGRLLDLVGQRLARLDKVSLLVLDEADRLLDMGFIRDVRRIVSALPKARQSLLFSATMPDEVAALAREILRDPVRIDVSPKTITVDLTDQHVVFVENGDKRQVLTKLLREPAVTRAIVFTRTKHGANRVAATTRSRRHRCRSDSRQQIAERAATRARDVQERQDVGAGRDRHCRARYRHRCREPRVQLRVAARTGKLRAPHRSHRPRRRIRHCDVVVRQFGTATPARHRETDPASDQRDAGRDRRVVARSSAGARGAIGIDSRCAIDVAREPSVCIESFRQCIR